MHCLLDRVSSSDSCTAPFVRWLLDFFDATPIDAMSFDALNAAPAPAAPAPAPVEQAAPVPAPVTAAAPAPLVPAPIQGVPNELTLDPQTGL